MGGVPFECDHVHRMAAVLTGDCAVINKLLPAGYFFVSASVACSVLSFSRVLKIEAGVLGSRIGTI